MRPAPIPAEEIWAGARRLVVGPPGNDLDSTVEPVEVLLDQSSIGPRLSARCILEDGDLELLTAGGTVWVSFYGGQLIPFSVDVQPPAKEAQSYVRVEACFPPFGTQPPAFKAFLGGVSDGMDPADFAEGCAQALTEMAAEWRAKAVHT